MKLRYSLNDLKNRLMGKGATFNRVFDLLSFTLIVVWQMYEFYDLPTKGIVALTGMVFIQATHGMDKGYTSRLITEIASLVSALETHMRQRCPREGWIDLFALDTFKLKYKVLPLLNFCNTMELLEAQDMMEWLIYELVDVQALIKRHFKMILLIEGEGFINYLTIKNSVSVNYINLTPQFEKHLSQFHELYQYEGTTSILTNLVTKDSTNILKLVSNNCSFLINHIETSLEVFFKVSDLNSTCMMRIDWLQAENNTIDDLNCLEEHVANSTKTVLTAYSSILSAVKEFPELKHTRDITEDAERHVDTLICCYGHLEGLIKCINSECRDEDSINRDYKNRFSVIVDILGVCLLALSETLGTI